MLCGSGVKDCIEGPRQGWGGQLWECCGDSVTILWVCLGYSVLLSPVRTACQTCVQARIEAPWWVVPLPLEGHTAALTGI